MSLQATILKEARLFWGFIINKIHSQYDNDPVKEQLQYECEINIIIALFDINFVIPYSKRFKLPFEVSIHIFLSVIENLHSLK